MCSPFIPENPIAKNILSKFMDEESADVILRWVASPRKRGILGKE